MFKYEHPFNTELDHLYEQVENLFFRPKEIKRVFSFKEKWEKKATFYAIKITILTYILSAFFTFSLCCLFAGGGNEVPISVLIFGSLTIPFIPCLLLFIWAQEHFRNGILKKETEKWLM